MPALETYGLDAPRSGASVYVLKDTNTTQLAQAVVAAQRYLSPPLSERASEASIHQTRASACDALEMLTVRERKILTLAAQGYNNAAIATRFTLSVRAVDAHRTNLMRKLDLHLQIELACFPTQYGLIAPPATPSPSFESAPVRCRSSPVYLARQTTAQTTVATR